MSDFNLIELAHYYQQRFMELLLEQEKKQYQGLLDEVK